jgi:hypothetical protein
VFSLGAPAIFQTGIIAKPGPFGQLTLQKDAEVIIEQDVGVEHDRAPGDLPRAVHLAQHMLAAAGDELVIRLKMRAVDHKRGLGLYLTVLQRGRLEIIDQVTKTALAPRGRDLCCRQRTRGAGPDVLTWRQHFA